MDLDGRAHGPDRAALRAARAAAARGVTGVVDFEMGPNFNVNGIDATPNGKTKRATNGTRSTVAHANPNAANDVRRAIGAQTLAEGHTLDDQAETVLMNLIRGGGLEAVGGIWPGGTKHGSWALAQPLLVLAADRGTADHEHGADEGHVRGRVGAGDA